MKVKDLLEELNRCMREYPDFLEWDVYTEQAAGVSDEYRDKDSGRRWIKDSEDWEYLACQGFWTKFPQKKAFTINVNY